MAQATRAPWVRGPLWDLGLLHFGWLPFYVLLVAVLGLDGRWSAGGVAGAGREPGLGLALTIALGVSYVHRHYTFLIVYGDGETFDDHRRAFTLGPALAFVAVALAYRFRASYSLSLAGLGLDRPVSVWALVLMITGAWNVWHTVMQRHGMHRVYAGMLRRHERAAAPGEASRGLLADRAHGRRDKRLVWTTVLLVAVVVLSYRTNTFEGIGNARRLLAVVGPWVQGWPGHVARGVVALAWAATALDWARHEFAGHRALSWRLRLPRLGAWLGTSALLAVFVVHGPVIGYLCFGTAHAVEYVAFVHHFGRRKFGIDSADRRDLLALVLRNAAVSAPVMIACLLAIYWLLLDARTTELFLVYYTATSLLHFWFDGLIWKVSGAKVSKPLGFEAAAPPV